MNSSSKYLYAAATLVAIGLVAFAATKGTAPSSYDDFARCITQNSVKMYGTWWCGHCRGQKDMFGSSFQYINYVECSDIPSRDMKQECKDVGVEGYPTWQFADGSLAPGEQSLETLSQRSGCELPTQDL
jgi:hypothetical protein